MLKVKLQLDSSSTDQATAQNNELTSGQNLIVGRTPKSDWAIPDRRMSSRHFKISVDGDRCFLNDLKSSNGTFLNGNRIVSEQLASGDEIRAGSTRIKVDILSSLSESEQSISDLGTCSWGEASNSVEVQVKSDGVGANRPIQDRNTSHPLKVQERSPSAKPSIQVPVPVVETELDSVSADQSSESEIRPSPELPSKALDSSTTDAEQNKLLGRIDYCIIEICGTNNRTTGIAMNQSVSFGTSSRATEEFVDPDMAGRHFQITFRSKEIRLECFDKGTPVLVNGEETISSLLFDGDQVVAGNTEFLVRLAGSEHLVSRKSAPVSSVSTVAPPDQDREQKQKLVSKSPCQLTELKTGLKRVSSESDQTPPLDFLLACMSNWSLFVLVDFFRFGKYEEKFLAKRIDAGTAGTPGAYLIPIMKSKTAKEWFEKLWLSDSAVFCLSKKSYDDLKLELVQLTQNATNPIFGLCWPSISRIQFENGNRKNIDQVFDSIDLVLTESDDADHWQAYLMNEQLDDLKKVGLKFESKIEKPIDADSNTKEPESDASPKVEFELEKEK